MLVKWLELLRKRYVVLLIFLAAVFFLFFLPVWQREGQSEATPLEEKLPEEKIGKPQKHADVFLPVKEFGKLHDPFLLRKKTATVEQVSETVQQSPEADPATSEKISLVGILRNGDKAKAMIQVGENMVSVEAGSRVAGYEVISIGEQEVFLDGHAGKRILSFAKH